MVNVVVRIVEEEKSELLLRSVAVMVVVVLVAVAVLRVAVVLKMEEMKTRSIICVKCWIVVAFDPVVTKVSVVVVSRVTGEKESVSVDVTKVVREVLLVLVVKLKYVLVEVEVGTLDLPIVLVIEISSMVFLVSVIVPVVVFSCPTKLVMLVVDVTETGTVTR